MSDEEKENAYRAIFFAYFIIGTYSDKLEFDSLIDDPLVIKRHGADGPFCKLQYKRGDNFSVVNLTLSHIRPFLIRHRMTPIQAIVILKEAQGRAYQVGDSKVSEVINFLENLEKAGFILPPVVRNIPLEKSTAPTNNYSKFEDLFRNNVNEQRFVEQAMKDLKITDTEGKYMLSKLKRSKLLGFIHALVERHVCPDLSDEILMKLFTSHIGTYYSKLNANQSNVYRDGLNSTLAYLRKKGR